VKYVESKEIIGIIRVASIEAIIDQNAVERLAELMAKDETSGHHR
jgi:hypothetical protein